MDKDSENARTDEIRKRFLGVKDIQKIFGIGRSKAVALMNTKGFPAIRLGRTYRVDSEKLEEWIDSEIKEQNDEGAEH